MHKSIIRRNIAARRGAALVEFAFVFPIILLFFTGMIEISRVLMLQHTADTAAYEAARSAMVPGATAAEAEIEANLLLSAASLTNSTITVSPSEITEETGYVSVSIEVPVAVNSWITPDFFQSFSVKSEVTLLTERSPIVRLTSLPKMKSKKTKTKGPQPDT